MTQHAQKIEAQRYEENLSTPNYSSAFWLRPAANSIAARIPPLSRSFGTDPASSKWIIRNRPRFFLNMITDYNARLLASDIKTYFESNRYAIEVLIFKGNKIITVKRGLACNPSFNRIFRRLYEK